MENSKIQKMLEAHKLWIDSNKKQGEPANLCGADLREAILRGADFCGANLCEANLCEANLDFFDRNFA